MTNWPYIDLYMAVSRFAPSQWQTALLCNDVSHWLGSFHHHAWQCHDMQILPISLALYAGKPPMTGSEFPSQRTRNVKLWYFCCYPERLLNTIEFPMIWDATTVMRHRCNDMDIHVLELRQLCLMARNKLAGFFCLLFRPNYGDLDKNTEVHDLNVLSLFIKVLPHKKPCQNTLDWDHTNCPQTPELYPVMMNYVVSVVSSTSDLRPSVAIAVLFAISYTGIILCMHPANERRRYNVTSSPIGWGHLCGVCCEFYVWLSPTSFCCHCCTVCNILYRDHFMYAPSQWETTLQCNVVSHWLGAYTNDPCLFCIMS